jgi:hypothetical protein
MQTDDVATRARPGAPADGAAFAAQVAAAWRAGAAGWDRLAAAWGVSTGCAAERPAAAPVRCWWDAAPWYGRIADEEFRAIVAAYVARYGAYTPDLPLREPALLEAWRRDRAAAPTGPAEGAAPATVRTQVAA